MKFSITESGTQFGHPPYVPFTISSYICSTCSTVRVIYAVKIVYHESHSFAWHVECVFQDKHQQRTTSRIGILFARITFRITEKRGNCIVPVYPTSVNLELFSKKKKTWTLLVSLVLSPMRFCSWLFRTPCTYVLCFLVQTSVLKSEIIGGFERSTESEVCRYIRRPQTTVEINDIICK